MIGLFHRGSARHNTLHNTTRASAGGRRAETRRVVQRQIAQADWLETRDTVSGDCPHPHPSPRTSHSFPYPTLYFGQRYTRYGQRVLGWMAKDYFKIPIRVDFLHSRFPICSFTGYTFSMYQITLCIPCLYFYFGDAYVLFTFDKKCIRYFWIFKFWFVLENVAVITKWNLDI